MHAARSFAGCLGAWVGLAALVLPALHPAAAQEPLRIGVQLNKLEAFDNSCRAYLVVENETPTSVDTLDLDLIVFRPDGVIGNWLRVGLGPLNPGKTNVRIFDIPETDCADVDRLLINGIPGCIPLDPAECLAILDLSTLGPAFFK